MGGAVCGGMADEAKDVAKKDIVSDGVKADEENARGRWPRADTLGRAGADG